jgi:hypothetical protein
MRCSRSYGTIRNVLVSATPTLEPRCGGKRVAISDDPRWEGNVQGAIIAHLRAQGWTIISPADTASQARGMDVVAERAGSQMLVRGEGLPRNYLSPCQLSIPSRFARPGCNAL